MIQRIINHPSVRRHAQQGAKFIVAGLLGATIDFSVLAFEVEYFGIDPHIAYIPSGLAAVVFVFFFNKYVTFRSRESHGRQGLRFAMVYSAAFVLNYLLASGLYYLMTTIFASGSQLADKAYLLAKAGAIGIVAVWNYCWSHAFVFKRHTHAVE